MAMLAEAGGYMVPPQDVLPPVDVLAERYDYDGLVGVGVFGQVFKAHEKETGKCVAIKKIKIEDEYGQGVPASILREVSCLMEFTHPNIVQLLDIQTSTEKEYSLVFEFVEADLHKLLKSYRKAEDIMPIDLVRKYTSELLQGLFACHQRLILHRDLKPQNILIGRSGLKIGDFGLARMFTLAPKPYTMEVITLWYRSPEILLGCQTYGAEVDMWSAGCIIAEMATGQATFPGDSEIGTVFRIFKTLGTPTEDIWPGFSNLEHYKQSFPKWPPTELQPIFDMRPEIGPDGMDLLRGLLTLNPSARPSARRAKASPFASVLKPGEHGGA